MATNFNGTLVKCQTTPVKCEIIWSSYFLTKSQLAPNSRHILLSLLNAFSFSSHSIKWFSAQQFLLGGVNASGGSDRCDSVVTPLLANIIKNKTFLECRIHFILNYFRSNFSLLHYWTELQKEKSLVTDCFQRDIFFF